MNQFDRNEERIAELAAEISDTPARVEDSIIDAMNTHSVKCIRVDACSTLPITGERVYRVWASIPGTTQTVFAHATRDDAELSAVSAVYQGAPYATIEWVDGTTWRQEVWAVS